MGERCWISCLWNWFCASVAAGIINGLLDNRVLVHLRGGDLVIYWDGKNNIFMEGVATEVFSGKVNI